MNLNKEDVIDLLTVIRRIIWNGYEDDIGLVDNSFPSNYDTSVHINETLSKLINELKEGKLRE